MSTSYRAAALASMRIPFLLLPPTCVALGAAAVHVNGGQLQILQVVLALVGAVAAHVGVNALNEHDDFRSGLDFATQRTPFSGGSGYLGAEKRRAALVTGASACVLTAGIGIYFLLVRGWGLLPVGLIGLVIVVAYTRWVTRRPVLCLVAPGVGFGTCMVLGSEYALSGTYTAAGVVASLVPFFLVSDLLLLNQFPDADPDARIGRRHLPIVIGRHGSAWIYALFLAGAFATVIAGVALSLFPPAALLALLALPIAVLTARGVLRYADDVPHLVPHMGRNVLIVLVTPVLMAVGAFVGG